MPLKLTRGQRNNNPLNIRVGNKWKGLRQPNTDGAFDQFIATQWGYRAAFVCLKNYINKHKCNTVRKIIYRWAPPNENVTGAYINTVCKRTGFSPDQEIKPNYDDLSLLVSAMAYVESRDYPTSSMLSYAWNLI